MSADRLTEKEKDRIIRAGKANDRMNKYIMKVTGVPVFLGAALIVPRFFHSSYSRDLVGIGLAILVFGALMITSWFAYVVIKIKTCPHYSHGLYEELLQERIDKHKDSKQKSSDES